MPKKNKIEYLGATVRVSFSKKETIKYNSVGIEMSIEIPSENIHNDLDDLYIQLSSKVNDFIQHEKRKMTDER
jgi:hypothetical protein